MYVLAQTIIMNSFGTIGFLANAMVVAVLAKFTNFQEKPSMQFILMQSVIDAVASLAIIFNNRNFGYNLDLVHFTYGEDTALARAWCYIWGGNMFMASMFLVSTYNLVFVTMERYFKILHSFLYMRFFRKWKLRLALFLPWVIGFAYKMAIHLPQYSIKDHACHSAGPNGYSKVRRVATGVFNLLVIFFIPIVIMAVSYIRIFATLRKASKKFKGQNEENPKPISNMSLSQQCANSAGESTLSLENIEPNISTISSALSISELRENPDSDHMTKKPGEQSVCPASPANDDDDDEGPAPNVQDDQVTTKAAAAIKMKVSSPPKNVKSNASRMQNNHEMKISRSERMVLKTLVTVTVCFFFCWVGHQALFFADMVLNINLFFGMVDDFVISLAFFNSVINPFIYVITLKEYRKKLFSKLRGK